MRSFLTLVFFFLVCGFCSGRQPAATSNGPDTADFVLVRKDHGVALYERWYSISDDLQAREVKATFVVKASAEEAIALIKDEAKGKEWNRNTESYKVLNKNDNAWVGYIQYDLPWPVSDQDCVLRYDVYLRDHATEVLFANTHHPAFPPQKRVQRIPQISGKWVFTERGNDIAVEYYITTTPSSTLPTWITDPIIRKNLIETLTGFREILEKNG